jgi:hypothetical protein
VRPPSWSWGARSWVWIWRRPSVVVTAITRDGITGSGSFARAQRVSVSTAGDMPVTARRTGSDLGFGREDLGFGADGLRPGVGGASAGAGPRRRSVTGRFMAQVRRAWWLGSWSRSYSTGASNWQVIVVSLVMIVLKLKLAGADRLETSGDVGGAPWPDR